MGPVLAPGCETHRGDVEEVKSRALRPRGPGVRVSGDFPLVRVSVFDEVNQTLRLAEERQSYRYQHTVFDCAIDYLHVASFLQPPLATIFSS